MKYIVHKDGQVLHAYQFKSNEVTLEYPGYKTELVPEDSNIWQDVLENPEDYTYKDGQLIKTEA